MSERLFADCCFGTAYQHAAWEPCPLGQIDMTDFHEKMQLLCLLLPQKDQDAPKDTNHDR